MFFTVFCSLIVPLWKKESEELQRSFDVVKFSPRLRAGNGLVSLDQIAWRLDLCHRRR
jgi:hypothetical protein